MRFTMLITGPAYGTQQASSAWLFAQALLAEGHQLDSIFFYREGVMNASSLTSPANDEFDLTRAWQRLQREHHVTLNICVAAALRRGITGEQDAGSAANLAEGFQLAGLGSLAEAVLSCERLVQF